MTLINKKNTVKKLNKYVTIFDCIDKILIVLSATTGGISIVSFTTTIGAPVLQQQESLKIIRYNNKEKEKA